MLLVQYEHARMDDLHIIGCVAKQGLISRQVRMENVRNTCTAKGADFVYYTFPKLLHQIAVYPLPNNL